MFDQGKYRLKIQESRVIYFRIHAYFRVWLNYELNNGTEPLDNSQ